jgi:TPR repeat protein
MVKQKLDPDDLLNLVIESDKGNNKAINMLHNYYSLEKYQFEDFNDGIIKIFMERAIKNNPYSLLQLSIMYYNGLGVPQDFEKGNKLLRQSIDTNCSQAYCVMAILTLTINVEYKMSYEELISNAIKMNNSSAYIQKGNDYHNNDFKKSMGFYKKAMKLHNDYATYMIGELYHDYKKYKKAIKYYQKAIDKKVHHAYFNLAVMNRDGEYYNKDYDKAIILFKKAMVLGNTKSYTSIGQIYHAQGNLEKAKKYHKLGIKKNDTKAKYNLGLVYKDEKKYKKTIKCFIESAKDGLPIAKHVLTYDYNVTNLNITDDEIDELLEFRNLFHNY